MEGKRATRSNESCPVAQTLRLSQNTESTTSFRHIYNAKKINDQNSINEELSIIYTNADSLTNKRGELKLLLDSLDKKPNIIVITEVNSKIETNNMFEIICANIA